VPDASGVGNNATATNVTWGGNAGAFDGSTSYVATQGPVLDTTGSFSVSAWANLASVPTADQGVVSQPASNQDGFRIQYSAVSNPPTWAFDRTTTNSGSTKVYAQGTGTVKANTWYHLVGTYDATTGTMTFYVNGTQVGTNTDTTPFAAPGPLTIGRDEWNGSNSNYFGGSISDVKVYQRVLSPAEVAALHQAGRDGGANTANQLTTTWALDRRGLPTSMTDPNGNTTNYTYDEAGRLAVTAAPAVSVQVHGQPVTQAAPVTTTGYNTFGEPAEVSDPNGNVTTTAYDADGHPVSVTQPTYTPPVSGSQPINAVTTAAYNNLGEMTSRTTPNGGQTSYKYDQLGDTAIVTAPDGGVTTYTYDTNGDQLSATGPTGAVTTGTYDYLGRLATSTEEERYPTTAAYTTSYSYGFGGWLSAQTLPPTQAVPNGVTTSYTYNAAGEKTGVTDGVGNTTTYGYDPAGELTTTTYANGSASTDSYDAVGRVIGQADLSTTGTVLRSDSSAYDANGNLVGATDYNGNTTTFTYDAGNRLSAETQPLTATSGITTSFGYDAAGNRTLYVDGNGNNWWTTYNPWNLPELHIEPDTAAHSGAAADTFTTVYDADGNPVTLKEPGGVSVTSTYNTMDQLTGQSGTGTAIPTTSRTFGYDLAGNLTSAVTTAAGSAPATSETFTYDDRGLPLTASGTAGSTTYGYNADDQVKSVADAAGTTSYSYDAAGRLGTLTDPLTGTTATYTYNKLSQVNTISYGTSNDVRTLSYNGLHRLSGDNLATAGGQAVASISYGYDPNGNLTSKTTTGFGGSAAINNIYTYDEANRLTSWNNGTATVNYGYDGAGNRTQAGNQTLTYDARDELLSAQAGSGPVTSYAYSARGTLTSVTGSSGTTSYSTDAYGEPVAQGPQSFTYDALGRAVSDTGTGGSFSLSYAGVSRQIAADGAWNYSYDPYGGLAGIGPAGGTTAQGVLAYTDLHTDLVGTFAPSGAALAGSAAYSPLGAVTAASGLAGNLGYQSGFTDPASAGVNMGARWYSPATGDFTTRDTAIVDPVPDSAAANPFAYAGDNPMLTTDPSGHMIVDPGGGGGHNTPPPPPRPQPRPAPPPPAGCPWWDLACHAANVYHHYVVPFVHHVVHVVLVTMQQGLRNVSGLLARGLALAGHLTRNALTGIADAARQGAHAVSSGWHAAVSAGASAVHNVTRWAATTYHQAAHAVHTAWHAVAKAANTVATFIKNHAATIASFAVSAAVFVGCDAALGVATGGVGAVAGAVACGALAGAAGNAVSYGITAAQTGNFSLTGLASSIATGAIVGAAGGFVGGLAASGLSAVGDAASSLLADGAQSVSADAAANAAATGANDAAAVAANDTASTAAGDAATGAGNADTSLANAPEEAGLGTRAAASCGGASFTAGTKVLLASGAAVPIARLHRGQKVLATSTRTGKTRPEPVAAVLVHHDTNRYNLKVSTAHGSAVIHTTRNHRFWAPTAHRWIKAAALPYGTHLRTPGGTASVTGGHNARTRTGWMWDLTITPSHDFYVRAAGIAVLVHNINLCDVPTLRGLARQIRQAGLDPRSVNQRTFAVGQDEAGNLVAGSSNGFDPGQRAMADSLGIRRVPSIFGQHAEENLITDYEGSLWPLRRVGTDALDPCGPEWHDCAGQLDRLRIEHQ
jgi:RHS repeat-associated protein